MPAADFLMKLIYGDANKGRTAIETEEEIEFNDKWYPIEYRRLNEPSLEYDDGDFLLKYFRRDG